MAGKVWGSGRRGVRLARVDLELVEHRAAKAVLGEHPLHRLAHQTIGIAGPEVLGVDLLEMTPVARELVVVLLLELTPGEGHLVGVDDDDVVASVDVGV